MSTSNGQQCCPSLDDLEAFSFGRHPAPERVAGHIDICVRCLAALEELEGLADPLLADLRQPLPLSSAELEEACACVLMPAPGASTTHWPAEATSKLDDAPPRLDGYENPTRVDHHKGGMGVVWSVRDIQFDRHVAIKVIKASRGLDPIWRQRFDAEACITAQLTHPSIVPVHAMGQLLDGRPYYTMKLVEGETLGKLLDSEPDVASQRADLLQIFLAVCQALAFAHSKGVIHCDLKPGNVMVGRHGEVQVMDWGLAMLLAWSNVLGAEMAKSNALPDGSDWPRVWGTFPYMSPEQANGRIEQIDCRSDVFGLGAMLCAILSGRPPYVGSIPDVTRQARKADLAGAQHRLAASGADPELIALARDCLSANPQDRPPDASAVEERLKGYLASVRDRLRKAERAEAAATARADEEKRTRQEAERRAASERRARRRALLAAGFFACSLALLLGMVFFARRAHDADQQHLADTIDKALTAAMGGDLEAAERAIAEAELAGASTGQVRMLRGQIALHRGQTQEALRHLQIAAQLLPDSVAARGMQASAFASKGDWERYDEAIREIKQLTPETAEDSLFKGHAEAYLDPELGLRTMEEAFRLRPNMVIARLLRAEVRSMLAQDIDDIKLADNAVRDAQVARDLLGDKNAAALWVSLIAYLNKASVHEHRGEAKQRLAALELAGKDADALKPYAAIPEAVVYRWWYLREVEREEEVLEELRRVSKETDHESARFCYALTLYRRNQEGDLKRALDVLEKNPSYNDRLLPFLQAEHDYHHNEVNWQKRALATSLKFAQDYKDGLALMNSQSVLCLLGRKQEAVEASKKLQSEPERFYTLRREPILRCLDYSAGGLTAEQLVKEAKGHQWDLCMAHYFIAVSKLAEGDRKGARDHFQNVVKTRAYGWGTFEMSWVFLARLEKNNTWPPWIPPKKDGD